MSEIRLEVLQFDEMADQAANASSIAKTTSKVHWPRLIFTVTFAAYNIQTLVHATARQNTNGVVHQAAIMGLFSIIVAIRCCLTKVRFRVLIALYFAQCLVVILQEPFYVTEASTFVMVVSQWLITLYTFAYEPAPFCVGVTAVLLCLNNFLRALLVYQIVWYEALISLAVCSNVTLVMFLSAKSLSAKFKAQKDLERASSESLKGSGSDQIEQILESLTSAVAIFKTPNADRKQITLTLSNGVFNQIVPPDAFNAPIFVRLTNVKSDTNIGISMAELINENSTSEKHFYKILRPMSDHSRILLLSSDDQTYAITVRPFQFLNQSSILVQINLTDSHEKAMIDRQLQECASSRLQKQIDSVFSISKSLSTTIKEEDSDKNALRETSANLLLASAQLKQMANCFFDIKPKHNGFRTSNQNLQNFISDKISVFQPIIDKKQLRVVIQAQSMKSVYYTNWKVYEELLFLLVGNAVSFSYLKGIITVKVALQIQELMIGAEKQSVGFIVTTLTDSGVGMTEQQQQNAFNPLCNEKGYLGGLGLQRVKSLAESLNGSVKIFSQLGKGSTITFRIPVTSYRIKKFRSPSFIVPYCLQTDEQESVNTITSVSISIEEDNLDYFSNKIDFDVYRSTRKSSKAGQQVLQNRPSSNKRSLTSQRSRSNYKKATHKIKSNSKTVADQLVVSVAYDNSLEKHKQVNNPLRRSNSALNHLLFDSFADSSPHIIFDKDESEESQKQFNIFGVDDEPQHKPSLNRMSSPLFIKLSNDSNKSSEFDSSSNEEISSPKISEGKDALDVNRRMCETPVQVYMQSLTNLYLGQQKGGLVQIDLKPNIRRNSQILPHHKDSVFVNDEQPLFKKAQSQLLDLSEMDEEWNKKANHQKKKNVKVRVHSQIIDDRMRNWFKSIPQLQTQIQKKKQLEQQRITEKVKRTCQCCDVLVINVERTLVNLIQEATLQTQLTGIDLCESEQSALQMISSKLQKICCQNHYRFIFLMLNLDSQILVKINETMCLWNETMVKKGYPQIKMPVIVGITDSPTSEQGILVNEVLSTPFSVLQVKELMQDLIYN